MLYFCCTDGGGNGGKLVDDVVDGVSDMSTQPSEFSLEQQLLAAMVGEQESVQKDNVFLVKLTRKPRQALGLQVDLSDNKCAHITQVSIDSRSPVGAYNDSAPPSQRIRAGDYIIAVNGLHAAVCEGQQVSATLQEELSRHQVELMVSRPDTFEVSISRNDRSLGLDLSFYHAGKSLIVREIVEGVVLANAPEVQVLDRIVAVNGIEGGHKLLVQAISKQSEKVLLTFSRPFPSIVHETGHHAGIQLPTHPFKGTCASRQHVQDGVRRDVIA